MVVFYRKQENQNAFICIPATTAWRLETYIEQVTESIEGESGYVDYGMKLVTSDMEETILVSEEFYGIVSNDIEEEDSILMLFNQIVESVADKAAKLEEVGRNCLDMSEIIDEEVFCWKERFQKEN